MSTSIFAKRVALVVAIASIPPLVWLMRDLILVAVGALVVAALLQLVSEPFQRWTPASRAVSLAASGLLIVGVLAGASWIFGSQIGAEMSDVVNRAQTSLSALQSDLKGTAVAGVLQRFGENANLSITGLLGSFLTFSVRMIEAAVVLVITAVYIAAEANLYRSGIVMLFPKRSGAWADETIQDVGSALRLWLLGQLIQMVIVGLLSFIALWFLGVHSPIGLGLIAAICEFIPYVGPILAGVPAVLVAFTQTTSLAVWTIVAYIIIHQIEGEILVPLVQRRLVFVPPAVMLLGLVAVQLFFGTFGVVFAGPIIVLVFVSIRKIYIRETLGKETALPGEQA